jgi:hypothetical protein
MIDYFALALGHGLLVLAFVRLFMRESLDVDPAIADLKDQAEAVRPNPRQQKRSEERQDQEKSQEGAVQARSLSADKAARRSSRPSPSTKAHRAR